MNKRYTAAIDFGSSSLKLTVCEFGDRAGRIVFNESRELKGIRGGKILNKSQVIECLRALIGKANSTSNININRVLTAFPGYKVNCKKKVVRTTRNISDAITKTDLNNLREQAEQDNPEDPKNIMVLRAIAQSYNTDEIVQGGRDEVLGAATNVLEGDYLLFTGDRNIVTGYENALSELGIAVARTVFVPDVMAGTILDRNETDNGVALLSIGKDISWVGVFHRGRLRYYNSIPYGSSLISERISEEKGISLPLAENLKLAYGMCCPNSLQTLADKSLRINNENGTYQLIHVRDLSKIVDSVMQDIVDALLYNIEQSGYADSLKAGIVVCGGGAKTGNILSLLSEKTGLDVRIAGYTGATRSIIDGVSDTDCCTFAANMAMVEMGILFNVDCAMSGDTPVDELFGKEYDAPSENAGSRKKAQEAPKTEKTREEPAQKGKFGEFFSELFAGVTQPFTDAK